MALIECSECKKEISDAADTCPQCGAPQNVATDDNSPSQPEKEKVPLWLTVGILFVPYVFSWVTLRKKYSTLSRVVSFGWMAIALMIIGNTEPETHKEPASETIVETERPTAEIASSEKVAPVKPQQQILKAWVGGADEDELVRLQRNYANNQCKEEFGEHKKIQEKQKDLATALAARYDEGLKMGMPHSAIEKWYPYQFVKGNLETNSERMTSGPEIQALQDCVNIQLQKDNYLVFRSQEEWKQSQHAN